MLFILAPAVKRGQFNVEALEVMADWLREWVAEVGRNPNLDSADVRRNTLSSSSSNLSLSPSAESGLDGIELDAARALACFSLTAVRESGGKRRKRHKNGSPGNDWEDSIKGRDLTFVPEDNQAIKVTHEERTNLEQISESPPANSNCSSNHISAISGRKILQNLTQAEREARRMNRVLANRESARQTIRRRQAIRDNLTKKVSELSLDNQNMKMEKEQVMKEYMLLKNKNKQLKVELAMAIECNIVGAQTTSASFVRWSSPHEHPFSGNVEPAFMPGALPPWPVMVAHVGMFFDDSDSHKAIGPRALFYVPPWAWFYSLLHRKSSSSCLMSGTWKEEDSDLLTTHLKEAVAEHKSSMNDHAHVEISMIDDELAPPRENTAEVKSYKLDIDLNFGGEMLEPFLDALDRCSSVRDETESNALVANTARKPGGMTEAVEAVAEQSTKFMDVSAAAAARRRRKEIMKLKHLCRD